MTTQRERQREVLTMSSLAEDFEFARPFIKEALKHSGDMHTLRQVLEKLKNGQAELFVGKKSAVVTQSLSNGTHLHFWLAGGDLEELKKIERGVTRTAKQRGFKKATIAGRRGWLRSLTDYSEAATLMVKTL